MLHQDGIATKLFNYIQNFDWIPKTQQGSKLILLRHTSIHSKFQSLAMYLSEAKWNMLSVKSYETDNYTLYQCLIIGSYIKIVRCLLYCIKQTDFVNLHPQGFYLRLEAGCFIRSFSIPCPVLWFQYLREFFIVIFFCYYNLFLLKHLMNLLTRE